MFFRGKKGSGGEEMEQVLVMLQPGWRFVGNKAGFDDLESATSKKLRFLESRNG